MVETNIINKSESLVKNKEHIKYPMRLRISDLFWVRLIAWMWAKGAECPSISIYRARIKYSLRFFGVIFF